MRSTVRYRLGSRNAERCSLHAVQRLSSGSQNLNTSAGEPAPARTEQDRFEAMAYALVLASMLAGAMLHAIALRCWP